MKMDNSDEFPENTEPQTRKNKKSFGTYAYLNSKYFDYQIAY